MCIQVPCVYLLSAASTVIRNNYFRIVFRSFQNCIIINLDLAVKSIITGSGRDEKKIILSKCSLGLENPGKIVQQKTVLYQGADLNKPFLKQPASSSSPSLSNKQKKSPAKNPLVFTSPSPPSAVQTFKNSRLRTANKGDNGADPHRSGGSNWPRSTGDHPRSAGDRPRPSGDHSQSAEEEDLDFIVDRKPVRKEGGGGGGRGSGQPQDLIQRKEEDMKTTLSPEAWLDRHWKISLRSARN